MAADSKQKKTSPQPIDIFATGNRVRCTVTIGNPGKEMLKVKSIEISGAALRDANSNPMEHALCLARIHPGQVRSSPVEFELDPCLAPGDYQGEFVYGDILRQPFVLHMPEKVNLKLFPSPLIIRGVPGQRLTKELWVINKGNVPIMLDKNIHNDLSEIDEIETKLADTQVQPMTINVVEQDLKVKPGQSRKFTLTILLPRNLKHNHNYEGSLEIAGREASLDVITTADSNVDSKEVSNAV